MRAAATTALFCCFSAGVAAGDVFPPIRISEIRIDHPGAQGPGVADPQEYIELTGPAGTALKGLRYVVVGDSGPESGSSGTIEKIINLDNEVIGPSGRIVIAQASFTLGIENHTVTLDFEDGGTVTHLVVANLSGASHGTRIDTESDGFVDYEPWDAVLDAIAIVDTDDDTFPYGPGALCTAGMSCNLIVATADNPGHFYRCGATGIWHEGAFDHLSAAAVDSPSFPNPCPTIFFDGFE